MKQIADGLSHLDFAIKTEMFLVILAANQALVRAAIRSSLVVCDGAGNAHPWVYTFLLLSSAHGVHLASYLPRSESLSRALAHRPHA